MIDDRILHLEKFIGKPIDEASKLGKIIKRSNHYYGIESNPIIDIFDECS